jgi:hypothetical protein
MTLGQADYHITKPWLLEQDLYRLISEFLANWAKDHQAGFDLFQVVGIADRDTYELRELLTRFNVPFRFHAASSHAVAARSGAAPLGLHPDRALRGAGRASSVAVAARPRTAPARDLDAGRFRRGRRPPPLDQAGRFSGQ